MTILDFILICSKTTKDDWADIDIEIMLVSESNPTEKVAELTGNWNFGVKKGRAVLGFETRIEVS